MIKTIIEKIKTLTITELNSLIESLESEFDIQKSAYLGTITNVAVDSSSNEDTVEVVEKTTFDLTLESIPSDKKIAVLKVVRNITGLGLKESKEIVDNLPKTIKTNMDKLDCENLKIEFESLGAVVSIK